MTIGMRRLAVAGAAAALLAGAGSAVAVASGGPPPNAPRFGLQQNGNGGYGLMAGGVVLEAAAEYIGIDEAALAAARHDGASLAQIATQHGKTVAGLEQALVAAVKTHLNEAVSAGRLTEAQAALVLERFQARVQTIVTRTDVGPVFGRGAGLGLGPGYGFGFGFGMGACGGRA